MAKPRARRLPPRPIGRAELVSRTREHLDRHGYSRLELSFIVGLTGIAGFLISYALLAADVRSMPLRYGAAGVAGYVAFLFLLWLWLQWKSRAAWPLDVDIIDAADLMPRSLDVRSPPSYFTGGRSGGGGAADSWMASDSRGSGGSSWGDAWDSDLGWILLVGVALLAGLATIGFVVYTAPALLAEVLVDGVIVAAVSRRVAGIERRDWTATVLRRTWLPALAVIALLVIGGWALQKIAPDARSIGPAVERIFD